ncbi:MAG TPA: ribosome recycling factor [Thermotogota bacterium]|nr:ribosome recycling factor [Thermotogota bacterium]NLZ14415.1 ribosome recycling factor [Thermotogaceae bacterium]MDD8040877.1 ribosome recycling factor [Thermotogota bacterium]HNR63276.1 ribosome recycling factor [Thermotogota bacterium]HNT95528.1 ribosome recycling factor [Thermotogota bacterium]
MNKYVTEAKEKMYKTVQVVDEELKHIRTGRPSPAMLDDISVDYYGAPTPVTQLASIAIDERALVIKPWDKATLKLIEKAILASSLGLTPMNDGSNIRLNFPPPSGEQKKNLVKVVKEKIENGKISIRNIRRDIIKNIKEEQKKGDIPEDDAKNYETEIQKVTDEYIERMDDLFKRKEEEIMEV